MCLRNLPNWACHRGARPASGLPHRGVLQTVWGVLFVLVSRRGDSGAKPQEPPTTRLQPGSGLHALPAAPSRKKGGTPSPHVTQPRTVSPRPPSRPPVERGGLEPRSRSRPARDAADLDVLALGDAATNSKESSPMPSMRPTSWGSARNRRDRTGREAVEMAGVVLGYRAIWHDRGPCGRHDPNFNRWCSKSRARPPRPPNRPRPVWGVISIPLI